MYDLRDIWIPIQVFDKALMFFAGKRYFIICIRQENA